MKSQKVHSAVMYHCPKCEGPNYRREVYSPTTPGAKVPGTDILLGGAVEWPPNWEVCDACAYRLTKAEQKPAQPWSRKGGVALPAWSFTCQSCGQQNFIGETIYGADGSEGPPAAIRCKPCGERFTTDYVDPSAS